MIRKQLVSRERRSDTPRRQDSRRVIPEINKDENLEMTGSNIKEIYESRKINYDSVKKSCEFNIIDDRDVDVSVIIPVKGRENFNLPLVDHLLKSMEEFKEKTYSITFVEHNDVTTHKEICKDKTNHIWIRKNLGEYFNKCLAMNVGALFSNKAKYYLFHDIDLLVTKSFFSDLFSNLKNFPSGSALQAFGGRKVVVMNNDLTMRILSGRTAIDSVVPGSAESPYSTPGAPGGSIFISSDSFYKIGGFDAEFFHSYSCEDAFFYHKAEFIVGMGGCNAPLIESFHMDHPRTNGSDNPDMGMQNRIYMWFKNMSPRDKEEFIYHMAKNIKKEDEKSI